jgi:hypothetical protein
LKRIAFITLLFWVFIIVFLTPPVESEAGPFAPGSEYEPFYPVNMNSPDIVAWATGWEDYSVGTEVDAQWKTPGKALGPAAGTPYDIVCLGRGGSITMTFEHGIRNGDGWDFAVFENAFNDTFLELGWVEVSTDGICFVRFDNVSLTKDDSCGNESIDYTEIHGLAGKYKQGLGTPFDLSDIAYKTEVTSGQVNLNRIYYVRVVDIVGDGTYMENRPPGWGENGPIYDPYPTYGSAGFDLDAIGVRYEAKNNAMSGILLLLLGSQD